MLAYRHAFHAGNHGDVLKHVVLVALLAHLNLKDKGWRYVDTHAGAGGYSLASAYAKKNGEFRDGIGRLWAAPDAPPAVAEYVQRVREFNAGEALRQYPGSPALAGAAMRLQDQLRLFELHPTDHKILSGYLGAQPGVEVAMSDGFAALERVLPPPTRRGLTLIDPSYELKSDYPKVLTALRTALARFADGLVMVWAPQVQLIEATQLPRRLKAAAEGVAKTGWLQARLTVRGAAADGFGMLGSSVFVANPPHTLEPALRQALPWLAQQLAQDCHAGWQVDSHTR